MMYSFIVIHVVMINSFIVIHVVSLKFLLNIKSLSKHELDDSNASLCMIQHSSYMLNLMSFPTQDGAERTKYLTSHFQLNACTYVKKVLCVVIGQHKLTQNEIS